MILKNIPTYTGYSPESDVEEDDEENADDETEIVLNNIPIIKALADNLIVAKDVTCSSSNDLSLQISRVLNTL